MFKKTLLKTVFLCSPFLQGAQLPKDAWNKIFNFCDFEETILLRCLNKNFRGIIDERVKNEIEDLKKIINVNYKIENCKKVSLIESNFFAKKLLSIDRKIVLKRASMDNDFRSNPLSLQDQHRINQMQFFIYQIIDKKCLELPLYNRGNSSDFVAEKLGLKNYSLFFSIYCFKSLYSSTNGVNSVENYIENFKKNTYMEYIDVMDPYFKITFFASSSPHNPSSHISFINKNDHSTLTFPNQRVQKNTPVFVPFKIIMQQILEKKIKSNAVFYVDHTPILKDFEPKDLKVIWFKQEKPPVEKNRAISCTQYFALVGTITTASIYLFYLNFFTEILFSDML